MKHLTPDEWYLWRKHSDKKNPWDRYLNTDFLKSERKRIKEVGEWNTNFRRVPYNSSSEAVVCYHVVPIKIRSGWLQYLEETDYLCKGLSALRNCPMYPMIAFFPPGRIPIDYSLIRINSSKKVVLLDVYKKSTVGEKAIIVGDWEELESDNIYVDVPFENRRISRIFEENIGVERTLAESLQSPIVSSPFILNDLGGISLASILDWPDFAHEFCKTMELMLPPEYRSFWPPRSGIKGRNLSIGDGIDLHVAERIVMGRNYFSTVESSNFKLLDVESNKRRIFNGEYSIFGAVVKSSQTGRQRYKDMLHYFFEFEVLIPDLYRLQEYDVYIPDLTKEINEDLWLQVVALRHTTPSIDITPQEQERFLGFIKADLETVVGERMPETYRTVFSEMQSVKCLENLKRVAKSLARAEDRKIVDLSLLRRARNNFLDRLWELENDDAFRGIKLDARDEIKSIRYYIVETILRELGGATAEEIYQKLVSSENSRTFFRDIEDLKRLLDWAQGPPIYRMTRDPKMRYRLG